MKNEKIGSNTHTYWIKLVFHNLTRLFFFKRIIELLKFSVQDPQWASRGRQWTVGTIWVGGRRFFDNLTRSILNPFLSAYPETNKGLINYIPKFAKTKIL